MANRTYISFDWALKRLLRDKANFDVLEGFLSTLLETEIKIHRLLESEGNKNRDDAKYNRVDLLAESFCSSRFRARPNSLISSASSSVLRSL